MIHFFGHVDGNQCNSYIIQDCEGSTAELQKVSELLGIPMPDEQAMAGTGLQDAMPGEVAKSINLRLHSYKSYSI